MPSISRWNSIMVFTTMTLFLLRQWSKFPPTPLIILLKMITATLISHILCMLNSIQCTIGLCNLRFPLPSLYILWLLCRNGRARSPIHRKAAALPLWYNYSTDPSYHCQRLFPPYRSLPLYHPKKNPPCPLHEERSQIAIGGRCASTIMRTQM